MSEGAADLARCVRVRDDARGLLEDLRRGADLDDLADRLGDQGAGSRDRAVSDARRFLEDLRSGSSGESEPVAEIDGEALQSLARVVLSEGLQLRFVARGRSMRPQIPNGSTLVVEPVAFEEVRVGMVVLFTPGPQRLVAHRVIERSASGFRVRGDSSARVDEVDRASYLGVVARVLTPQGDVTAVSRGWRAWLGRSTGAAYGLAVAVARAVVIAPLRHSFRGRSIRRVILRVGLRLCSAALLRIERVAHGVRERLDPVRAALLSTVEKDRQRRRLYRRRAVQDFTSLDENVESGLTLIEEALLARHELPSGEALVLGCGPGRECLALAERGYMVTGLDRESGMLVRARDYAASRSLKLEVVEGDAQDFDLGSREFDLVVVFSGLINMVMPRARRVAMLRAARRHLSAEGRVLVTFLSAYVPPGEAEPPASKTFLEALNPEHRAGDRFLLNESIHVYPRGEDLVAEAAEAGLECSDLYRDQRAYDRAEGRVRGYAVLRSVR